VVQVIATTSSVASGNQNTVTPGDTASAVATSLPLSQQVSSEQVQQAIESRESNVNDLSVPVYVNNQLPKAEPENPIIIQTGQQTQLDIITVNGQIVQVQDTQGFRVSVGSVLTDGTFAAVNSGSVWRNHLVLGSRLRAELRGCRVVVLRAATPRCDQRR
jgi:hypothetical protein